MIKREIEWDLISLQQYDLSLLSWEECQFLFGFVNKLHRNGILDDDRFGLNVAFAIWIADEIVRRGFQKDVKAVEYVRLMYCIQYVLEKRPDLQVIWETIGDGFEAAGYPRDGVLCRWVLYPEKSKWQRKVDRLCRLVKLRV